MSAITRDLATSEVSRSTASSRWRPLAGADLLDRVQCGPTGENRHAAEQRRLLAGEQVVAPVEGGGQRLVTGLDSGAPLGEEAEAVMQALGDVGGPEGDEAGGGQLDGKGNPVEATAYLGDSGQHFRGEGEGWVARCRPGTEQCDRLGLERLHLRRPARGAWQGQRAQRGGSFSGHPKGLLAGSQDPEAGTVGHQALDERRTGGDHVLAVVQDQ